MKPLRILSLVACFSLVGCATANLTSSSVPGDGKVPKPTAIYYTDADVSGGTWHLAADQVDKFKGEVRDWFNELLPERLSEIAPAKPYTGSETTGWLIKPTVDHFDSGSAAMRILGAGMGQSKIVMTFTITDLSNPSAAPMTFKTEADDGWYNEYVTEFTGPKKDIWRTCRQLVGKLKDVIAG